jgi:hypothetical protein
VEFEQPLEYHHSEIDLGSGLTIDTQFSLLLVMKSKIIDLLLA